MSEISNGASFWQKLKKPFFVMAPLANVTDTAFRELIAKYSNHGKTHGGPDVFFTEFVSADGLASTGRDALKRDLEYTKMEHPIVAQLFGANPEKMEEASRLCRDLGFDGIDINMGCPDKTIEKQESGVAMMKDPKKAREIIESARRGSGLPISVKTRIGYNKNQIEEWIPELLSMNLSAITVHLRTRKEMSNVPAHWELMPRIVEMAKGTGTLIIGNGDVKDLEDAKKKIKETGCDGVMLGRAIFGRPWLFSNSHELENKKDQKVLGKILKIMVEHTKLFEKKLGLNQPWLVGRTDLQSKSVLGRIKSFAIMKKHYKAYVNGFDGAKELRMKLMEAKNSKEVEKIVKNFLKK